MGKSRVGESASKQSLLLNRDFVLLMCGKLVSLVGSGAQFFALSWYILETTGSTVQFSTVYALQFIPMLIIQPVAGVLVDRFDRKKIIVGLDILSGISVGAFALIFKANGTLTLAYACVLVMLLASISAVFQPAIITTVPVIVDKDKLPKANNINAFIMSIGSAIAPAIGGVILDRYGLFLVMAINAVSFILSAISEMFIRIPVVAKNESKFSLSEFKEDFTGGLRFVLSSRTMLAIIGIAFAVNLVTDSIFDTAANSMLLGLKVSDAQIGYLKTIALISPIAAPIVCGMLSRKMSLKRVLYLSAVSMGCFTGVLGVVALISHKVTTNYMMAYIAILVVVFILKMLEVIGGISLSTACQQETPRDMLGRVGTLMSTAMTASAPVGLMVFGLIFDFVPLYVGIAIAAVVLLVTTFLLKPLLKDKVSQGEAEAAITE